MYLDINHRGSGKTTRIVDWFVEDMAHRGILVNTAQRAINLRKQFHIPKRFEKHILCMEDILYAHKFHKNIMNIDKIQIDDIDEVLKVLHINIDGFTLTPKG